MAGGFFAIFAEVTAYGAPAGYYPAAGYREGGALAALGSRGLMASSVASGELHYIFDASNTIVSPSESGGRRHVARSVRCLQEITLAIRPL